ncbi:MAG: ribosomal protein [Nitrospirae bacterium]|jgi:large subunit ribosomal protein L24|nr:ribosomal protein [Nitrospirota bacterium]MBS1127638.1 ribosomal protein [Nitrospirota bacterium]MBS1242268.1 ribosomal protein [Nitrospirota bacterium]
MQIKKNDTVLVTSGKEKGKRGRVIAVYPRENRVLIEKLNMIKRHTRPNQQLRQGGIVEKESPISAANVKLICAKCDKPTSIARKAQGDGTRVRVCKACDATLE